MKGQNGQEDQDDGSQPDPGACGILVVESPDGNQEIQAKDDGGKGNHPKSYEQYFTPPRSLVEFPQKNRIFPAKALRCHA
ncbi:hypothetical protein GCM10007170_12440 [Arthrobacter liuii]|uniref:Uncharacterized protein n=1 Tax=Arthrobacter liuii TaxID=1476996 RepID=A0ABQ2AKA7_9MICC|nr:hypothetical protein GCM10007170_12440 [Arthrobacter liuii]